MLIVDPEPVITETVERLQVCVYTDRQALGAAAGRDVAAQLRILLKQQPHVRMVFAAAPSQNEFLATLAQAPGIDWSRITVFHMDEYIGLPEDAPQRFGRFLSDRLFDLVKPGAVHLIESDRVTDEACARYAALLAAAPIDIVCMGIGENGHIAFNDPDVADFNDPLRIKPVTLDLASRLQQVHDGCFTTVEQVPTHALTLTIPTLFSGKMLVCIVPGATKREAVHCALHGPILPACPASVLRTHPACVMYLDMDAYPSGA